jgi:hypothetical protein
MHRKSLKLGIQRGQQANQFNIRLLAQDMQRPFPVVPAAPRHRYAFHLAILS